MKEILLATNNSHKKKEFQEILSPLGYQILTPRDLKLVSEPEETGKTFEENAILKAMHLYQLTNKTVISDDSGIEVDALGGRPGVYSARYGKPELDDKGRAIFLLEEMKGKIKRTARYVCAICLVDSQNPKPKTFLGTTDGLIAEDYDEIGKWGFGYDPVFVSKDLNQRFSQVEPALKHTVSHRYRALEHCLTYLRELGHQ